MRLHRIGRRPGASRSTFADAAQGNCFASRREQVEQETGCGEEGRIKQSRSLMGRKMSDEHKAKMKIVASNRSPEQIARTTQARWGHKKSAVTEATADKSF